MSCVLGSVYILQRINSKKRTTKSISACSHTDNKYGEEVAPTPPPLERKSLVYIKAKALTVLRINPTSVAYNILTENKLLSAHWLQIFVYHCYIPPFSYTEV